MRKVSIVLPTHNGSKYLRRSIESCLSQTHADIELIVVDDCSTDSSPEIIQSFKDDRLVYVRNQENQRLPRSLNIGFAKATGDYLTWTSDDNEYMPDAIEKMLKVLEFDPEAEFVYSDYWTYDESKAEKELVELKDMDLRVRNAIGGSFLYTRKAYQAVGDYNPYYEMVEDYDYWLRLSKRFKMAHCAEPIYLYRYHAESLTMTRSQCQDLFDVILKYRNGFLPLSKLGWTAAYFFENILKSDKNSSEKKQLISHTRRNVWGLSPMFYALFCGVAWLYSFKVKK